MTYKLEIEVTMRQVAFMNVEAKSKEEAEDMADELVRDFPYDEAVTEYSINVLSVECKS